MRSTRKNEDFASGPLFHRHQYSGWRRKIFSVGRTRISSVWVSFEAINIKFVTVKAGYIFFPCNLHHKFIWYPCNIKFINLLELPWKIKQSRQIWFFSWSWMLVMMTHRRTQWKTRQFIYKMCHLWNCLILIQSSCRILRRNQFWRQETLQIWSLFSLFFTIHYFYFTSLSYSKTLTSIVLTTAIPYNSNSNNRSIH